jgi:hypothetical protein
MAGTEIVRISPDAYLKGMYVLLPDGTVRRPLDYQDFDFWSIYGAALLGWYKLGETFVGDVKVSTCFVSSDMDNGLGWDWTDPYNPAFPIGYRPLCFETMIFGGDLHGYQARTVDYHLALENHEEAVRKARGEGVYKCPRCGMISHNPNDAAHRYCGACCRFEGDPEGMGDGEEGS